MAKLNFSADIDLSQNEVQNAVLQNLASDPASGSKAGRIWYNSSNNVPMYYNGTDNVEFGKIYTEGSGIDISSAGVISIDNTVTAATKCKVTYNGQGLITGGADLATTDIPDLSATYVATSLLGANSGVATLGVDGKIPSTQLPSYVDDVIDAYIVSDATALTSGWLSATDGGAALTPETGKIYVILTSGVYQNKTYRWSGTTYVEISADSMHKFSVNNPALTASSGVVTWEITNSIGSADVLVQIFDISTGSQVMTETSTGASTITVKMNSASNISADTYKAVIVG